MKPAEQEPSQGWEQEDMGARLRAAREYLGLSQDLVSKHLGVPRPAVSAMEHGQRKVSSLELKKLARLYGRPVSYFLGESEEPVLDTDKVSAALFRATQALSEDDRVQVLLFAEFLGNTGPAVRRG